MDYLIKDSDLIVHFAAESQNDNFLRNPNLFPFLDANAEGTTNTANP
jgi:dTDP-glucose 4,6-dehydratase